MEGTKDPPEYEPVSDEKTAPGITHHQDAKEEGEAIEKLRMKIKKREEMLEVYKEDEVAPEVIKKAEIFITKLREQLDDLQRPDKSMEDAEQKKSAQAKSLARASANLTQTSTTRT